MKLTRKIASGVICATLLLASMSASALTLGKMRGAALLGKELDVAVIVQLAEEDDLSSLCFSADVLYGDNLVEPGRLSVRPQPGPVPNTQLVRISASSRVDDAVVTINLKAGCGVKASRRYVLLADLVSELAAPPVAQSQKGSSMVQGTVLTVRPPTANAAVLVNAAPKTAAKRSAPSPQRVIKKKAATTSSSVASANAMAGVNPEAITNIQQRLDSIEKWQAQTTIAEDLLKSQERSTAFEADMQGLKTIISKNQQNLESVNQAVLAAESDSYGLSLVYALVALLVVCVGSVAWVVVRTGKSGAHAAPWWFGAGESRAATKPEKATIGDETEQKTALAQAPVTVSDGKVQIPKAEATAKLEEAPVSVFDIDLDIDLNGPQSVSGALSQATSPQAVSEISHSKAPVADSVGSSGKALNTQEMLDIRQQAEFFMALGQHDDAVKLLSDSIHNSNEANPLVFLDLLKIFHTLSRREEFERFREEFNQHFTGRVPPYADFLMEGNGLDAYEDICQQIVVLWPTEYTVDFIEQCLVRVPEDDPEQGIDLEAFKDLLLLYGILKRLDQASDSAMQSFSMTRTPPSQMGVLDVNAGVAAASVAMAPGVVDDGGQLPVLEVPSPAAAPGSPDLHLDLDLDLSAQQPEQPQVAQGNLIDFDLSGFGKPNNDPKAN